MYHYVNTKESGHQFYIYYFKYNKNKPISA